MSLAITQRTVPTLAAGDYSGPVQTHRYDRDEGVIPVPVAGPLDEDGNPVIRYIRVHQGFGMRTVDWTIRRGGKPPLIPAAKSDLPGDRLISSTVMPDLPQPDPSRAGFMWSVSGTYTYVQKLPRTAGKDTFPTGTFPYPIEPNAQVAGQYVSNAGLGVNDGTGPEAISDLSNAIEKVAQQVISDQSDTWVWPFTHLPAICSTDDAIAS